MYLCSVELLTEAMKKIFLFIFAVITTPLVVQAQIVEKELKADFNRASGMFYARKAGKMPKDTPAPSGKKPFYINHYGCPGSYYLDKSEYYTETYAVLAKADSLGKLTKLGKDVLRRISMLYQDAEGRYGELTTEGAKQTRSLMKQMVERFPDMFTPKGYYSVRSIVLNRCIMTMEEALLQLSSMQQPLVARSKASLEELKFMDGIDKELASQRIDSLTRIFLISMQAS